MGCVTPQNPFLEPNDHAVALNDALFPDSHNHDESYAEHLCQSKKIWGTLSGLL